MTARRHRWARDALLSVPLHALHVINVEKMALPGVWPLAGTVAKAYAHYYADGSVNFPPPGFLLEVSYYGELKQEHIGTIERDNHDTLFLAWLQMVKNATDEKDKAKLSQIKEAAQNVPMRWNLRNKDSDKILSAYQHRESEEANADLLGHSMLARARELCALQDTARNHIVLWDGFGIASSMLIF